MPTLYPIILLNPHPISRTGLHKDNKPIMDKIKNPKMKANGAQVGTNKCTEIRTNGNGAQVGPNESKVSADSAQGNPPPPRCNIDIHRWKTRGKYQESE